MNGTELPVNIRTYRINQPRLDVVYPVITDLPNPQIQQYINDTILREVYNLLYQQQYPQNPRTESTAYYEIKTNERGILSLSLINYAFSGGAHGLTLQKSLTFNVQTGKLYALQDLFKPGSDYVKILSAIAEQQIKTREIPLLNEFKGIQANQDYYIADKALVIYFQVYELTAYVYGFTYFPISVYEIQSIIDEEGPLGKMIY